MPATYPAKPRSDVYVGLLVLALLAQIAGAAFLYLDYSQYPDKAPPKVQDRPRGAAAPGPGIPAPAPPPGGMAGMAGNPPGAGMGGAAPPAGMGGEKAPMGMMGNPPPGAMMGKAPGG
jgi:hypothetical protein